MAYQASDTATDFRSASDPTPPDPADWVAYRTLRRPSEAASHLTVPPMISTSRWLPHAGKEWTAERTVELGESSTDVSARALARRLLRSLPKSSKADSISFRHGTVVQTLLGAAFPLPSGGRAFLRPLWAEEAMNRAMNTVQLVLLLGARSSKGPEIPLTQRLESALAETIAALFRSLHVLPETAVMPCAGPLSGIVTGLVELFSPGVSGITVTANLTALALPAYRRRALVLAAAELVTQAILLGARGRRPGQILVALEPIGSRQALLSIEDDVHRADASPPVDRFGIVSGLAGLLEAEVTYRRSHLGGTAAELLFPI